MTLEQQHRQYTSKYDNNTGSTIFNKLEIRDSQIRIDGVELVEHIQRTFVHEIPQLQDRGFHLFRDSNVRIDRICQASRYLDPSETCLLPFLECCVCKGTGSCRTNTFFIRITHKERDYDLDEHVEWTWKIPLSRFEVEGEFEHSIRFAWNSYWNTLGLSRPST